MELYNKTGEQNKYEPRDQMVCKIQKFWDETCPFWIEEQ